MIFLGAGASKTFGIKTLQEMSEDLIQMMETKGYADTVERILSALNRFSLTPDFEAIYTIVKGLVNASQTVKESGPFTAFVCKELHDIEPRQNFEELLKDFNGFLYEECRLKPEFIDKISMTYGKLFTILKDSGAKDTRCLARASQLKQAGIGCEFPVGTDDTIITTNYDMIIETYQRIRKEKYADGFRLVDGDPTRKELDLATYSFERQKWLIKLHGSIYEYRENNEIFK